MSINAKTTVHRGGGMSIDWHGAPPAIGTPLLHEGEHVTFDGIGPAGMLLIRHADGFQGAVFPHEVSEADSHGK